ncbi:hypothetical protein FTX61_01640 [Nitriliruptoraceae bacterium ZYF776]|nr:hypothetical protein [Profundirhabdus halotolerans]
MLVLGLATLFLTLRGVTGNMRALLSDRIQEKANASVGRAHGLVGIAVGAFAAVAVMTSTIVTVTLIPLVAAGTLTVRNAYPITIGANIGTTLTAQLAALATGQPEAMVIALVHLLFNLSAVAIIYPWPPLRWLPVRLAEHLGDLAARRRWLAPTYAGGLFVVGPLLVVTLL